MNKKPEPSRPIDAYRAWIDGLVEFSQEGSLRQRIVNKGIYSDAVTHSAFNRFITSLSPEQRQTLAELLYEERNSAIATVLSDLTWWIFCRDVALTFRGEPMPVELSENGPHGDFVGRCNGWTWLAEGDSSKP